MKLKKQVKVILFLLFCLFALLISTKLISKEEKNIEIRGSITHDQTKYDSQLKLMATGDILIHRPIYLSAHDEDSDTYDFHNVFEKIKPLLKSADITIGNFEGTIRPQYPYLQYPVFNAPIEIVDAIKEAGYDIVSLANNHQIDSKGPGIDSTYYAFNDKGISTIGTNMSENQPILVKEVNGIKVAFLAYTFGFNGMEKTITKQEYDLKLEPLIEKNIHEDILEAQKIADIIVVYPHMGVEYVLTPTTSQKALYTKMIDWGADIVLGNHPHVVQPTEIIEKDGQKKFILYSLGNFLSNQRLESVNNIWTERGLIMEINIERKLGYPVAIESIVAHPTWVYRESKNQVHSNQEELYTYYVLSTQQVLNGEVDLNLNKETIDRIQKAHFGVLDQLNLER